MRRYLQRLKLFRDAKGGIYFTFEIAEQKPNFIAKNKPYAPEQNDRQNNQQKNFGFTHYASDYPVAFGDPDSSEILT